MALTGLDIYKLLPKTNCKECGFATCLAFAMALAQKKVSLDKCPHVTAAAREALESASQPPVKLVTVGTGERRLEMGNETVLYRHEQRFFHPAGIGFLVEDTLSKADLEARVAKINGLRFERVGQSIGVDLICVKNSSGDKERFAVAVQTAAAKSDLSIALCAREIECLRSVMGIAKSRRPLIIWDSAEGLEDAVRLAKENLLPIAATCQTIDEAAQMTQKAKALGIDEIVINLKTKNLARSIQDFTFIRRSALKKNYRPLGYPIMAFTGALSPELELAEAISYVTKYASLVIVRNIEKAFVLPLLVARQDIYQDPQKPVQVEPKIYEVGRPTKDSPVLVTTNFSITYFTVAGEVEASKVSSYIIACDAEGMSVLTAWAAEKFTAEKIAQTLKRSGIEGMVAHRKVVIPGYVSVLSGKLEEESGWKVSVGPREASGIPAYLRGWKET